MERFDPVSIVLSCSLPKPQLGDNRSHETRLRSFIEERVSSQVSIPLSVCRKLSAVLLGSGYSVEACLSSGYTGWDVTDVFKAGTNFRPYGIAVDLGSTTVVFYLVDLVTGKVGITKSFPNPQRRHGEDILSRILFAKNPNGLETLQGEVVDLFNQAVLTLTEEAAISPDQIVYMTVAGNTTMIHFLLALDPSHICKEPYIPVANHFDCLRASEIGLKVHPMAWLYIFPNVGSYFGGDLLAGILASGMHLREDISILVDVGTNAEVVLGNRDWMVACAGAAGPALEGGILACGMRAQPGAIERVEIDPSTLEVTYKTIGDGPPKGLCGSGIIDLLAAMFMAGVVDPTGKLCLSRDRERVREFNGELVYVVADEGESANGSPVFISQSDIKNLVRSKGAMYTILNVVIQSVGIDFDDIENFFVAGAFGNYIDPKKAITIGMLPDIPLERFKGLGNAAGSGAVEALNWRKARDEVEAICEKLTYLEMNVRGDFMNQLTGALFLPHTDMSRFPSVKQMLSRFSG